MDANSWIALALLVIAALLLIITASAEAGVVTISRGRARLLAERGEPHGRALHHQASERAATYAALTVLRNLALVGGTSLLAYLLVDTVDSLLTALLLTFAVAVAAALLLQIVPQFLVMQRLERWALALTPLAQTIRFVFGPLGWLFTLPARWWLRFRGVDVQAPDEISEAEELLRLVEIEHGDMQIEAEEAEMIRGVIQLDETMARETMVPRIDIVAVDAKATISEAMKVIVERGVSRVPVYQDSIDNIVGVLYAKDVLRAVTQDALPAGVLEIARPPYFIPEAKKIDDLLREFRQSKVHIAIVVDEYGGTAGLVTIEDLLEEIVGEIEDEYDVAAVTIEQISRDEAVLDARVAIDDLARLFDVEIESDDFDTVGGFVYTHLGKIPSIGDEIQVDGLRVRILSVSDRRIQKVLVRRVKEAEASEAGENAEERERVS